MTRLFDMTAPAEAVIGYAQVALEQGIDAAPEGLTYAIPPALGDLRVGERVMVPLGRGDRPRPGFVAAIGRTTDLARVKAILARDRGGVALTADLVALARWLAAYYCCPLGMVFATMVPAAVKRGTGAVRRPMVGLAEQPPAEMKLTRLQQAVLEAAKQLAADGVPSTTMRDLADRAGARTVTSVKQLVSKGWLSTREGAAVQADACVLDDGDTSPVPPPVLSEAQQAAVERLTAGVGRGFAVHLLHGVTGSGKTEVYLRMIDRVLTSGSAGAIVLVPEIALTPQTVTRFRARFEDVAVLHSGLTAAQRHQQWRRIQDGRSRIVVGARSAIFAPMPAVGVIVVDEEHDGSYKQDQLPRYHARDVAIRRAQLLDAPVVLGSATPSLESFHNATHPGAAGRPKYDLLRLPQRVTGMTLPRVQIVDMIQERRRRRGVHLLSGRLEDLLGYTLREHAQTILLLNRRGYANYIACPDHGCGWIMSCDHCDVMMVYHRDTLAPAGGVVRCHHCHAEQLLPQLCPACRKKVTVFGLGTQRVEDELQRKFEQARVLRMDSDAMRSGRDYHASLTAFAAGRVDVLVGTQMIAKGLDFPNVRLVGVISADTALHLPDFRAAERTFQLIAQVAGRAGRGREPGIVVVQTFNPDDETIKLAAAHDYEAFAQRELALRAEVGLPPCARMARIVVRHREHAACVAIADRLAGQLAGSNRDLGDRVQVHGPMPCPIARIAEHHRQQIELMAPDAAALQQLMTAVRNRHMLHADAHVAVDVDPVVLM